MEDDGGVPKVHSQIARQYNIVFLAPKFAVRFREHPHAFASDPWWLPDIRFPSFLVRFSLTLGFPSFTL